VQRDGWLLNTADNHVGPLPTSMATAAKILVTSRRNRLILACRGTLTSTWMAANGTVIGAWTLNTVANQFGVLCHRPGGSCACGCAPGGPTLLRGFEP